MKLLLLVLVVGLTSAFAMSEIESSRMRDYCKKSYKGYIPEVYVKTCIEFSVKYKLEIGVVKECTKLQSLTNACLLKSAELKLSKEQIRECRLIAPGNKRAPIKCLEIVGKNKIGPERIYDCISDLETQSEQLNCLQYAN